MRPTLEQASERLKINAKDYAVIHADNVARGEESGQDVIGEAYADIANLRPNSYAGSDSYADAVLWGDHDPELLYAILVIAEDSLSRAQATIADPDKDSSTATSVATYLLATIDDINEHLANLND